MLLVLAACSRSPQAAPQRDKPPADAMTTKDAKPGTPGAAGAAIDAELERALLGLAGEHAEDFGPAMKWLVEHPDRSRKDVIAIAAGTRDDMQTRRAFEVVGRIGNPDDVPVLAKRLASARGTLAADVANGLALHAAPAASTALADAATSPNPDVARAAITALGVRKDQATRPALEKLLASPDAITRYRVVHAIIALGPVPSRDALAKLRKTEKDPDVAKLLDQALR
jgi:HEAT repeat protein